MYYTQQGNYNNGLGDTNVPVLGPSVITAVGSGVPIAAAAGFIPGVAASSLVVPVIGAAIAGITLIIGIWVNKNKVYHAQEKATTQIVNQAEQYLQQNIAAWNNSNKTPAEQQQAASNFYQIWDEVTKACLQQQLGNSPGDPGGNPGTRCVEDRMPNGMTAMYSGQSYVGNGKWDWFSYYLTPITSYVQPQPTSIPDAQGNFSVSNISNIIDTLLPNTFSPSFMDVLVGIFVLGGLVYFSD